MLLLNKLREEGVVFIPAGLKSIKVWPGSLSLLKDGVIGRPEAEPGLKWSMAPTPFAAAPPPPIRCMVSKPVNVRFRIRLEISPG